METIQEPTGNCREQSITLSCSVTLEKREPFFGKTVFSGAATKKGEETKGATEQLTTRVCLINLGMYVYVCMHVCMYVCMYVGDSMYVLSWFPTAKRLCECSPRGPRRQQGRPWRSCRRRQTPEFQGSLLQTSQVPRKDARVAN